AVGYFVNVVLAVISIVGHDVFGVADRVRESLQGVEGGLELPGIIRGLAEVAAHNKVTAHIDRRLGVVSLLEAVLAGGHNAGFGIGKIHLVFAARARLGWSGFAAGNLFARALLFGGPLGHPLFVFGLFLLI